jgi:sugar phosphate isomerase/epimerase
MNLFPSACIWLEPSPVEETLRRIKITAFHFVDTAPSTLDTPAAQQALKDLGLKVSCVVLDFNLPSGFSLDGTDETARRSTLEHLKQALRKCQSLGARVAYVGSCAGKKQLDHFARSLAELAEDASKHGIKLCVEHVPGRALPSAREALAFVEKVGHANLFLLLDVGHTLISKEKPWEIIEAGGNRIGYVQLDDNDGKKDRHWALLEGLLTEDALIKTIAALKKSGYQGTLGLELKPMYHTTLISGFSRNHNLIHRILNDLEKQEKK